MRLLTLCHEFFSTAVELGSNNVYYTNLFVRLADPGGAGGNQFDSSLTGIVGPQASCEILFLLQRDSGLLVD